MRAYFFTSFFLFFTAVRAQSTVEQTVSVERQHAVAIPFHLYENKVSKVVTDDKNSSADKSDGVIETSESKVALVYTDEYVSSVKKECSKNNNVQDVNSNNLIEVILEPVLAIPAGAYVKKSKNP